jgi:hypothetical protein
MKHAKKIIIIIQLLICNICFSQRENIDSLEKILPALEDTLRIDCLTKIGVQFIFNPDKDSVNYYTNLVYEESKKINYIHGLAESCVLKAAIANHFYNDFSTMEKMAREALMWFSKISNKKDIEIAYWQLGRALTNECNYDEAITNLDLSSYYAKKIGNDEWIGNCLETMTDIYRDRGEYAMLFETQQKLMQMDRRAGDTSYYSFHELWVLGLMYRLLEEYSKALPFWRKLFVESKGGFGWSWNQMEYAELLTLANQPDSALYYYSLFDSAKARIKDLRYFFISKGEYYLYLKQYSTALPYFLKGLGCHKQVNDKRQINRALIDIAKTYSALERNNSAIFYAKEGLAMALQTKAKPYIRDAYEILYTVYDRFPQTEDSAYYYYRSYKSMKEAVMTDQVKGKIATYDYERTVSLINKEKQLQQQQLAQSNQQKKFLLLSTFGILLLGFVGLRYIMLKRKNERQKLEHEIALQKAESDRVKAELQQQATELKMQALSAQMNPHFIFNSLNSINRFILQNDKLQASEYLTKFSKLVRLILHNSQAAHITLESELEALNIYLDLEALRFEHHFDYTVTVQNDLDVDMLKVPPLILQPYAENAIWHGLMHKEENGHLDIEVAQEDDHLIFKITDDGIGRKQAAMLAGPSAARHKSMGLKITEERIAMMEKLNEHESPVTINDLVNADGSAAGTEVLIKIPILND